MWRFGSRIEKSRKFYMDQKVIKSALISVYHKTGLAPIVQLLHEQGVTIYSTGGTQRFIEELGIKVEAVEKLTGYPSILDGRVKTLHPKVFGGILARREASHQAQLQQYDIPEIDLVIVDLYPFEETVAQSASASAIIEKIDIGGISLIRAAAKNFEDVLVVAAQDRYEALLDLLENQNGSTTRAQRKAFARHAFAVSSNYDTAIFHYFSEGDTPSSFRASYHDAKVLRYGENPHQEGVFYGALNSYFDQLHGKELSYNNLVDIDAAVGIIREFVEEGPTFAILKHTNACGVATRNTVLEAWKAALAGDPISAFGGILITNRSIDAATAEAIDQLFYEVLIAPDFEADALAILTKKKTRILLKAHSYELTSKSFKTLLNGVIQQDADLVIEHPNQWRAVTQVTPTMEAQKDLLFALKCVKHLKSNTIALVKGQQLIGMGCGQTSRIDALKQAIDKARRMGFDPKGAVMASDAFFPFADSVEVAFEGGIEAVIQPGGSKRDQDSIDFCNAHGMAMVFTGVRHFKH